MLKRRLIPKLQLKRRTYGGRFRPVLVTTVQFGKVVDIGDPVSQAKIYEAQAADELIFVDLDATPEGRLFMTDVIRLAAEEIFMPITVGGGVRALADFRELLNHGADKVAVNSAALERPDLINEASDVFGAQCVVLSIDYRVAPGGGWRVFGRCGRAETGRDLVDWAREGRARGAGEILMTSMDRDGCAGGLDVEATRAVTQAVDVPVITSGGCGLASHFVDGFLAGGADAVSAGTFFCFKDQSPMQTRAHIRNAGIPIRLHT